MSDEQGQEQALPVALREAIAAALHERGALTPCPRCGHQEFTLSAGAFFLPFQNHAGTMNLGGRGYPLTGVTCKHCGYVAFHNVGLLGILLPGQEQP